MRLIDADALLIKIDEANYTAIDIKNLIAEAQTVEQDREPVLYWNGGSRFCTIKDINFDKRTGGTLSFGCDIPLYTSPQRQQPLKRLDASEIGFIFRKEMSLFEFYNALMDATEELNYDH